MCHHGKSGVYYPLSGYHPQLRARFRDSYCFVCDEIHEWIHTGKCRTSKDAQYNFLSIKGNRLAFQLISNKLFKKNQNNYDFGEVTKRGAKYNVIKFSFSGLLEETVRKILIITPN